MRDEIRPLSEARVMCVKLVPHFSNFIIFLIVLYCITFVIQSRKFKKCRASKKRIFIFGKFYVIECDMWHKSEQTHNNTIKKIIKFEKYENNFTHMRAVAKYVNATCKQRLAAKNVRLFEWSYLAARLYLVLGWTILAIFIN